MNEYKENIVYKGNIIIYTNNTKKILKTTYLIYSKKEDCFIDLIEALNPSLELCDINGGNKENILDKIDKQKYSYKRNELSNEKIVDEESLIIIAENKMKGR